MDTKKSKRQQNIIELITAKKISTQEELNQLLEARGILVNQSSISRDLVELGLIKIDGIYSLPEIVDEDDFFGKLDIQPAGENLLVLKCNPGLAGAIALKIDDAEIENIVGTIAGDDTIFIAVKNAKAQTLALKDIWTIFGT
ncbi:MAG: arginine repressor [Pyrinomonadaceae bacterium]